MKKLIIALSLTSLISCSANKPKAKETTDDTTYGYSEKKPIKVGGITYSVCDEFSDFQATGEFLSKFVLL